jgi:hypothetical protein
VPGRGAKQCCGEGADRQWPAEQFGRHAQLTALVHEALIGDRPEDWDRALAQFLGIAADSVSSEDDDDAGDTDDLASQVEEFLRTTPFVDRVLTEARCPLAELDVLTFLTAVLRVSADEQLNRLLRRMLLDADSLILVTSSTNK